MERMAQIHNLPERSLMRNRRVAIAAVFHGKRGQAVILHTIDDFPGLRIFAPLRLHLHCIIHLFEQVINETLSELRILMNHDRDTADVFTLILAGEPSLATMIQNKDQLESLRQRVISHYRFTGMSNDEINAYVSHKLSFAGDSDILVVPDAFRVLCESSQGVSRTIDHIMSDVLTWGIQMKHRTIDA